MEETREITINESLLVSQIGQLQYRVAKLEGFSEAHARKIAHRICTVLVANLSNLDLGELFSEEALSRPDVQRSLKKITDGVDRTIEGSERLRGDLDAPF